GRQARVRARASARGLGMPARIAARWIARSRRKCSTQFVIVCAFLTSAVCGRAIRFGRSSALRGETGVVQEWPTEIGDVLILRTSASFTVYVVGRVATVGQQDFSH